MGAPFPTLASQITFRFSEQNSQSPLRLSRIHSGLVRALGGLSGPVPSTPRLGAQIPCLFVITREWRETGEWTQVEVTQ